MVSWASASLKSTGGDDEVTAANRGWNSRIRSSASWSPATTSLRTRLACLRRCSIDAFSGKGIAGTMVPFVVPVSARAGPNEDQPDTNNTDQVGFALPADRQHPDVLRLAYS